MASAPDTDAILMAAGLSHRFGQTDKLLVPFRGQPLALHTLQLVCRLRQYFGNIFFITSSPAVARLGNGLPVCPIRNKVPQQGSSESVRLGVAASTADYYMFFPCDMPLLDEATVKAVLAARRPGHIVVPAHERKPGNPALFSSFFRPQLLALPPGEGARTIKEQNPGAIIELIVANPFSLADADTPEQLKHLENIVYPSAVD